jgi:hypothetical protein
MNTHMEQNGTRRPATDMPPSAWEDMEARIEHSDHEHPIQGWPQTGERTPPEDTTVAEPYGEMSEPPETPPICLNPPRPGTTWPKAQQTPQTPHGDPGQAHPQIAKGEPHPGQTQPDPGHAEHPHETSAIETVVPTSGGPRQNQRNLTPAARAELYRRVRDYVMSEEDPVGYHRANGHVHGTPQFLPWHRQFLERFERWQRRRLADPSAFIPLAFWEPADPIPAEFPHSPRNGNIPRMPPPQELAVDRLSGLDYAQFAGIVEAYHNQVHDTIGGDMRDTRVSPQDPCFWLFHAYVDNVFSQWEAMRAGSQT